MQIYWNGPVQLHLHALHSPAICKTNSSSLWDVCCNEWQQELRTARENAARKREELQHLNQVLCEDVSDVSNVTIHMSHTRRYDMPPYATVGLIWFDRLHTSLQGRFPRPCRCRSNFSKKWMQREGCECCPFLLTILRKKSNPAKWTRPECIH